MGVLLRDLLLDNPMLGEANRVGRRFLRTGGETSRGVNYVVLATIGFFYLWLLVAIVRWDEDLSEGLLMFELIVITLVVPASIYGAVSGERERATWEALILTRLTPAQIIAGKILWRVFLVALIMTLFFVPMLLSLAVSRYHNGLTILGLLRGQALVFAWALGLLAFGLWVSTNTRRSVTSIGTIIAALFATLVLLPLLFSLFDMINLSDLRPGNASEFISSFLFHLNPFYALGLISRQRGASGYDQPEAWFAPTVLSLLPVFYLIGGALFLYATYHSLRKLEEPKRRSG